MVKKVQLSKKSLNKSFKTVAILPSINVTSQCVNGQLAPHALKLKKVKLSSPPKNAESQTDFIEVKIGPEHMNIFFCTFHSNGDVETYCDAHPSERIPHVIETFPKSEPKWPVFENSSYEDFENIEHKYREETQFRKKQPKSSKKSFRRSSKLPKSLGTFNCAHCQEEFSSFYQLSKHSKLVHDSSDFSFPCSLCNATFTRPHNLSRHLETKHSNGEKKFACSQCKQRFNRSDSLATHTQFVHAVKTVKLGKCDSTNSIHCSSCNKQFTRIQNLYNHRKGNLSCAKCSQKFPCKAELQNHLYKYHSASCACGKVCANKRQLYFHKLTHSPQYKCQYCGKMFLWKWNYTIHLATHTGIKPLKCKICNKSFAHKYAVTKHVWHEHTESNKKFPCKICGKSFIYETKLKCHLRSHTGERPFKCHLCSLTFSQSYNLSSHVKVTHAKNEVSSKKDGLKLRKGGTESSNVVLNEFPESESKEEIKVYTSLGLAESFNDDSLPKTEPEWPASENSSLEGDFDNIEHKHMEETHFKNE